MSAGELAVSDPGVRPAGLPRWMTRALSLTLFAVLPTFLMGRLIVQHGLGWDFRCFSAG